MLKGAAGFTFVFLLYITQHPQYVKNVVREMDIYDSVAKIEKENIAKERAMYDSVAKYCCHATQEELEFIHKLKQDERKFSKGNR